MRSFEYQICTLVKGKKQVYELYINGKCLIREFIKAKSKDGISESSIKKLFAILESYANGIRLPYKKFHPLKGIKKGDKYTEYECKSDHLRLYFFLDPTIGDIILLGGDKNNQDSDVNKFRSLKKQFITAKLNGHVKQRKTN